MAGPALRKTESHASIHEAALQEARELTNILGNLLKGRETDNALETAYIIVEHWETRTLAHADAEERSLYKEIAETSPELKDNVVALTRDHNLMRNIVNDIKEMLERHGVGYDVLQRFQALILVDELHNLEEEKILPEH
ncbi:MAG TPA: hemerythrin domain-containing protein [Lentibacillus sp.]|uniref:hemerythrin domain-containing protein n=1 Tax=Lentibacillus sp. TaxID=1925746 RepID=UPI002B4AE629|nr:hemerythrin domain-containing protein [Lentibacillus sp.]HLR61688.1 hemerythrin domain-containing protein [Lentibacillus sp.]